MQNLLDKSDVLTQDPDLVVCCKDDNFIIRCLPSQLYTLQVLQAMAAFPVFLWFCSNIIH